MMTPPYNFRYSFRRAFSGLAVLYLSGWPVMAAESTQVEGVRFRPKRGVYTNAIPNVTVTTAIAGAEIRYTVDAEAPTSATMLYTSPFVFAHTATIRAAAFKGGFVSPNIDTHTYIAVDDVLRQSAAPAGFPITWTPVAGGAVAADYAMNPAVVSACGADMTNALMSLPSLSIVTPQTNLFDRSTGIYVNPLQSGRAWERGASAEWIDPGNTSRFQIDCGLRIQGGAFRSWDYSMKKSFTLRFRKVYGKGRLKENLFSGSAVESFNDLVLRAGANDAWNKRAHTRTQYIVDEFMRRTHLAMGGVSPRGTFVHLYLNGLYWGLYNVTEKITGEFAADYCGGSDDTWDVLSPDATPQEGNFNAWNAMIKILFADAGSNATYQRVQGNHPDGTRNPLYPVYLDLDDYIDYMIAEYWSANVDWPYSNWRAFRDRNAAVDTGFKFGAWDCEAGLGIWGDIQTDLTGSADGVAVIQSRLIANAEYKLRFADRVHKHLFNGGALTPKATQPRYQELAAQVEPALVAELARWGDQDGCTESHSVEVWRNQRDYVLNTFLTRRGAIVLQQFKNRGLYPSVDAPVFSRYGGVFTDTLNLTITAADPVYYTLDGRDPREHGTGAVAGIQYRKGVQLTRTTRVKARARTVAGEWSALTEAFFPRFAATADMRELDGLGAM